MLEADNENGLKIIVSPVGASIRSITFNGVEMLNTPKNDNEFFNKESTFGKTLGPVLNNKFDYEINGKAYSFNKDYVLNNVLFAGTPFMDKQVFSMNYSYKKKKMKDGLPSNVQYFISYSMATKRNEILVDYRVICDKPTPINLSNNIQFMLGSEHLNELFITIPTSKEFSRKHKFIETQINEIFDNDSNKPIVLQNEKVKLEIETDFEKIYLNSNPELDSFRLDVLDDLSKDNIVGKNTIYHHQILYRFETL